MYVHNTVSSEQVGHCASGWMVQRISFYLAFGQSKRRVHLVHPKFGRGCS